MKITFLVIGKTDEAYLREGLEKYLKRLKHYIAFQYLEIPDLKNTKHLNEAEQKSKEAELILKQLKPTDQLILLDENGEEFSSEGFAAYLNKKMLASVQNLVFVVGGPYGFDPLIYQKAQGKISLSRMTFSHQMVRLFFTEQVYRAFTILKGEPYHHS
ncbi:MAG: 23S rRNA (pseudouridine(1915)-N(3))-methyltransferase RlmH [Sphingobacteriaceae bacterium]